MAYNLFIAYDLMQPGQNYDQVKQRISELGDHYQFQYSLFYVHSQLAPEAAWRHVAQALDANDRLAVINAASIPHSFVSNWDNPPIDAINSIWFKP